MSDMSDSHTDITDKSDILWSITMNKEVIDL